MALQKRSRLHKLLLTFDEAGKYVNGEALFQEGAWNTETEAWEGAPLANEHPLTNMTSEGKKFLNDVIGVAATKALETAAVATEALRSARDRVKEIEQAYDGVRSERSEALKARDNFAALHKEAKGALMEEKTRTAKAVEIACGYNTKLSKIPALIRKLFGAI